MRIVALLFFCALVRVAAAQPSDTGLVEQQIVYKSAVAGEVHIAWAVNYWMFPEKKMWPPNTSAKGKFAYTRMDRRNDSFFVTFRLPANTRLDYFFWVPKNAAGQDVNGWDTNADAKFTTDVKAPGTLFLTDAKLVLTEFRFNLLWRGAYIFLVTVILFIGVYSFYRNSRVRKPELMAGLLISAFALISIARLQINSFTTPWLLVPGALFSDLVWLFLIAILFVPLYLLVQKNRVAGTWVFGAFTAVLTLTVLASLSNIEVVRKLGTPFNYRWLYYSDFLKGNDAREGIAQALNIGFIKNITLLLCSFLLAGYTIAMLLRKFSPSRNTLLLVMGLLLIVFGSSFYQSRVHEYNKAKLQSPFLAFITSVLDPEGDRSLLQKTVPDSVRNYIDAYHQNTYAGRYDSSGMITNIIVFVSESTPQQFVSLYDSTYQCTPHIARRRGMAAVYTSLYAHMPSTPKALFTLLSGQYPEVDYRSSLLAKPQTPIPSLPAILQKAGWATGLFFSSDLSYSQMDSFAATERLSFVQDQQNLACQERFSITQSELDGVNDSCLVTNYFQWLDTKKSTKNLGILWTNQTHYPYYTTTDTLISPGNNDLNRYLNALTHTDRVFDALMRGLEERKQLDSTLVIFIADHGEAFGTHNQRLHASGIYQENVHIPCILFNPVLFKGTVNSDMHGLVDIAPTITHIVGAQKPAAWKGKSLFVENKGGRTFFSSPYTDLLVGTVSGNWKYIYNAEQDKGELYDLSNDPAELKNVAKLYANKAESERTVVAAWVQYQKENFKNWKK